MALPDENVVIVTLGNDLRGDDGAGILLGQLLKNGNSAGKALFDVINAGDTPENYTGVIAGLRPDTVIIADTMDFGGNPGDIMVVASGVIAKESSSTHGSLRLFTEFLEKATSADILILGFQPKSTAFGEDISPEVSVSIRKTAGMLLSCDSVRETIQALQGENCCN